MLIGLRHADKMRVYNQGLVHKFDLLIWGSLSLKTFSLWPQNFFGAFLRLGISLHGIDLPDGLMTVKI